VTEHADAGVLVIGTLAKLLVVLAVVGTAGYDAISIASAQIGAADDAQEAALEANNVLVHQGTPQMAYAVALKYSEEHGETFVTSGFRIGEHDSVTVELRREAHTIAAAYLPRIKDYTVATVVFTFHDPLG